MMPRLMALRCVRRWRCSGPHVPRIPTASSVSTTSTVSWRELLLQARLAAVPMVGFGFMDNIIMIQAGDLIDTHLGVTLGISTLTAAALGNVCSDSSGVLFGGAVESAVERLNLSKPKFTASQAKSRAVRLATTGGSLVGVICGCVMGMSTLLLMDLEAAERIKRAEQLSTVFDPVMQSGKNMLGAERVTLYLHDKETNELWTRASVGSKEAVIIKLPLESTALACHAARSKAPLNITDAYADPRFDPQWDAKYNFRTRQVLCLPLIGNDGELLGMLQAVNKREGGTVSFTDDDVRLMSMMASHISIFIENVG